MAQNVLGSVDVPLALFGGLNTELAPSDIPEGVSPDCQDVAFLPGSVFSRPGLHKTYTGSTIPIDANIVYQKTYVQPNADPLNLLFDATHGTFWKEDVLNLPGSPISFGTAASGSLVRSVTAFGREYIAVSDGLHGIDIPRQFDGVNFDRVSQDGPGAAPIISFYIAPASTLVPGPGSGAVSIVNIVPTDPNTVTTQEPNDPVYPYRGNPGFTTVTETFYTTLTVNCAAAHGLVAGSVISIAGNSLYNFASQAVAVVVSATVFKISNNSQLSATGTGGTVTAITPFLSRINNLVVAYTSAPHGLKVGWNVTIAGIGDAGWNGAFYIQAVPSPTSFAYTQQGPNAITTGATTTGTVTPKGQMGIGVHNCVQMFLTRQGYLTKPSPPTQFTINGGEYLFIQNMTIGPPNVVARVFGFTPANGGNYFSVLAVPIAQGSIVGTSTIIADNVTASAIMDFADTELMAANAIDIPGNNLFAQVVLGPCLGVTSFAGRLVWWGERNKVQNIPNMGFEGGAFAPTPNFPAGWFVDPTARAAAALVPGDFGLGWRITGDGTANKKGLISQPVFQDAFNIAVVQPSTAYTFRCWLATPSNLGPNGQVVATLSSVQSGFGATASIPRSLIGPSGKFLEAPFTLPLPGVIPADITLSICTTGTQNGEQIIVDEMELIYTDNPFFGPARMSYVQNPEAYDGVTGVIGPASDASPLRNTFGISDNLYFLTAERLHITSDVASSEPANWTVSQRAQDCGCSSAFGCDVGEDWAVWASPTGLRIYEGGQPLKLSQEIQTLWDNINPAAVQTLWLKNDAVTRRIYIGCPTGASTTPNLVYVMDYRELDAASAISGSGPVHVSYTGKMISSDLTRKWTIWSLPMVSGSILARPGNVLQMSFGGQFGNIYYLDSAKLTDDDYGQIKGYYTTYFFVNHEAEQALQLSSHRKLFVYATAFVSGVGTVTLAPLKDALYNPGRVTNTRNLLLQPKNDTEWPLNTACERAAFKIMAQPLTGTDNSFNLNKLVVTIKPHPMSPIRGGI